MTLADVAIVLVMRLAGNSVLRALIPLATAWDVKLVAEHALKDELVIDRKLDWILSVHLAELSFTLDLVLDTVDDVVGTALGSHDTLYRCIDTGEPFDVFIRSTLDALMQVLVILGVQAGVSRQMYDLDCARATQECTELENYGRGKTRTR